MGGKKIFSRNGHNYEVVPCNGFLCVIRDGRFTAKTENMNLYNITSDNNQSIIAALFD